MTEQEFNELGKKWFSGNIMEFASPLISTSYEHVQIISETEDAFTLDSPVAGRIQPVPPISIQASAGIIRLLIGYSVVSIMKSEQQFLYKMNYLLNHLLVSASKTMGPLDFRKITLINPDGYFCRNNPNVAGYELRLHISKMS